ncbi:MAG: VOC family protein [Rhodobacterales bacterium]|nr:VOC family protein [Rhodobacterales bacterium]
MAGSEQASDTPRATGVGGVLFKSKDPKALREWYGTHLGLVINDYGSVFEFRTAHQPGHTGYLSWSPFADSTTYFQPSERDFMINYRVFHLDVLLANLATAGVEQVGDVQRTEYGDFAHILDPEGNKVELWEPVDAVFERLYDGKTTK